MRKFSSSWKRISEGEDVIEVESSIRGNVVSLKRQCKIDPNKAQSDFGYTPFKMGANWR
jgi:hypothetical protein